MHIINEIIDKFWNGLGKEERESLRVSDRSRTPVLLVGNGITRLAKTQGANVSWYQWVRTSWEAISPPVSLDYAIARGLTLPECISYLQTWLEKSEKGNAGELKRQMYERLWRATEQQSEPGEVHMKCVEHFNIIITTNYDTLLERACNRKSYKVRSLKIGAAQPDRVDSLMPVEENERTIVKLHGSFPYSGKSQPTKSSFEHWYDGLKAEDLIASVKAYRRHHGAADELVEKLGQQIEGRAIVVLGYGMSPEDDLVINLIERFMCPTTRVGMTYGGDLIDHHRFELQWGIKHLTVPADRGGGNEARERAHVSFIEKIRGQASEDFYHAQDRALLIGQASVNYVLRLERTPQREQAYPISQGPGEIKPVIISSAGSIGGPNLSSMAATGAKSDLYETKQVGGQMLVPALFMNQWGVNVALASAIGYDQFGLDVVNRLNGLENLDWHYVVQDSEIDTEHSYVTAFHNNRIMFDSGTTELKGNSGERLTRRINEDIERGLLNPRLIYLSRWFLDRISPYIKSWAMRKGKKEGLVLFETGNWGGAGPDWAGKQIGENCDIVLSSVVFTMRLTRMPLYDPISEKVDREWDALEPLDIWDGQFLRFEPVDLENRAYQYKAFGAALREWGLERLMQRLEGTTFGSASWWVITLGEVGIMALHRGEPGDSFWVKCPNYWLLNSAGCGDVARAGFASRFMANNVSRLDFLNSPPLIENAVRYAVAAGSLKGLFFRLEGALKGLTWARVSQEADSLEVIRDLSKSDESERLASALMGICLPSEKCQHEDCPQRDTRKDGT